MTYERVHREQPPAAEVRAVHGGEIGIATGRMHARGPVGLGGLTSLKYVVFGEGHIRT